jgi:hypothetical protein
MFGTWTPGDPLDVEPASDAGGCETVVGAVVTAGTVEEKTALFEVVVVACAGG